MPTASQQEINEYYYGIPQCESCRYRHWFATDERKSRQQHRKMVSEKWSALTPDEKAKLQESFKTMREHEDYR